MADKSDPVQDAWDAYQDALSKSSTANGKGVAFRSGDEDIEALAKATGVLRGRGRS